MPLKNSRFLCRSRLRSPELLKAALNALIADERTVDGPGGPSRQDDGSNRPVRTSMSGRADL
jgi:hypothetical protein